MSKFIDTTGQTTLGIAMCARCKRMFPLAELSPDRNAIGLMVCLADNDQYDPWRLPPRQPEKIALPFVRPDEPIRLPGSHETEAHLYKVHGDFYWDLDENGLVTMFFSDIPVVPPTPPPPVSTADRQERMSMLFIRSPWRGPLVDATEPGFNQGNRQAAGGLYSGVVPVAAPPPPVVVAESQKRMSMLFIRAPWRGPMVDATEPGFNRGNRQAAGGLYSGV